ncbi:MAG TPA: DUF2079 domain-containing protein, partial [Acidimicrobiales bacterium]|nr:DUF2079 domain-containing protein [Acidimicrobiales bacterium]
MSLTAPPRGSAGGRATAVTDAPAGPAPDLGWLRRVGLGLLGLQLAGLLAWSAVLASRYALARDFAIYHQVAWLVAHGHLDPFDTVDGFPFWRSHGELLVWPLGLLQAALPWDATLLWVQDLCLVGAEAVAFLWLCDLAPAPPVARAGRRLPALLAAAGLVLLVADPWIYWAASWDFHLEVVGALFTLLAARELYRRPEGRRLWLWVGLALACGDVVATYLVGIGLGGVLAGRRWRRAGLLVALAAAAWAAALSLAGANRASGLVTGYGYLATGGPTAPARLGLGQLAAGVLRHPQRVAQVVWARRLDVYAALGPAGVVGVASPWALPAAALVLAENALNRYLGFLVPGFQDLLVFLLVPVGTVAVLAALARRRRRWVAWGAAALAANALA